MKLIALKEHTPDGTNRYKKGQRFEMSAAAARVLIALKLAAPDVETLSTTAVEAKRTEDDSKRAHLYKRRDLKAESLGS